MTQQDNCQTGAPRRTALRIISFSVAIFHLFKLQRQKYPYLFLQTYQPVETVLFPSPKFPHSSPSPCLHTFCTHATSLLAPPVLSLATATLRRHRYRIASVTSPPLPRRPSSAAARRVCGVHRKLQPGLPLPFHCSPCNWVTAAAKDAAVAVTVKNHYASVKACRSGGGAALVEGGSGGGEVTWLVRSLYR